MTDASDDDPAGRVAAAVALGLWILVALAQGIGYLFEADRPATLGLVAAAGGVGLAAYAYRGARRPGTTSSGPAWALVLGPVLWAAWSGSWAILVLAIPAGVLLAVEGAGEPFLPDGTGHRVAVLLLAYLALAPLADGLVLGPAQPGDVDVSGGPYEAAGEREAELLDGRGRLLRVDARAADLPDVELVSGALSEDADRTAALEQVFQNRSESTFVWPLPPVVITESETSADVQRVSDGWSALTLGFEDRTTAPFFLSTHVRGREQVLAVKDLGEDRRLHLVPPFLETVDRFAGYRFYDAGNNSRALEALDGNVYAGGERLTPPVDELRETVTAGPYERHDAPLAGPLATVLAALAAAAIVRRRPGA